MDIRMTRVIFFASQGEDIMMTGIRKCGASARTAPLRDSACFLLPL